MISVTMRSSSMVDVAFEEPHWSAAKDLIRELESQGCWSFVAMTQPDTWDDGIPHTAPTKPPYDPLKSGWETCGYCFDGTWGYNNRECEHCDGLGIVVGPPRDGIHLVELRASGHRPFWKLSEDLIRQANAFPTKD
jgi:hypothetical protein